MNLFYILTCEHASNKVPLHYEKLFKGNEEVLYTHKAIDFGAFLLAKHLEEKTYLPFYYNDISRLLVESNRSPANEELFSKYSIHVRDLEKKKILDNYYYPHRIQVQEKISSIISSKTSVIHLAIHTFTPVIDGKVRDVDIGILFDPQRPLELKFATEFKKELLAKNIKRKVKYNSPYPGTDDGFPTYLRKCFSKQQYGGIELEVNQKFFLNGDPEQWNKLVQEITDAFLEVMKYER